MMRIVPAFGILACLTACSTAHPTAPTPPVASAINPCTWYVPTAPGTMRLVLTQNGRALTGTFTSDFLNATLTIAGTVDQLGVVHLEGKRPGTFRCFEPNTLRDLALGSWTTEVTKSGGLAGSFKQSRQQISTSCYTGMYDYETSVVSLTRQ